MSADLQELKQNTQQSFLRAMAYDYSTGTAAKRIDAETCIKAADEIKSLYALLEQERADAAAIRNAVLGAAARAIDTDAYTTLSFALDVLKAVFVLERLNHD